MKSTVVEQPSPVERVIKGIRLWIAGRKLSNRRNEMWKALPTPSSVTAAPTLLDSCKDQRAAANALVCMLRELVVHAQLPNLKTVPKSLRSIEKDYASYRERKLSIGSGLTWRMPTSGYVTRLEALERSTEFARIRELAEEIEKYLGPVDGADSASRTGVRNAGTTSFCSDGSQPVTAFQLGVRWPDADKLLEIARGVERSVTDHCSKYYGGIVKKATSSLQSIVGLQHAGAQILVDSHHVEQMAKRPPMKLFSWIEEHRSLLFAAGTASAVALLALYHIVGVAVLSVAQPWIEWGVSRPGPVARPLPLILELQIPREVGSYLLTAVLAVGLGAALALSARLLWKRRVMLLLSEHAGDPLPPLEADITPAQLWLALRRQLAVAVFALAILWSFQVFISLIQVPRRVIVSVPSPSGEQTCFKAWPLWVFGERRLMLIQRPSAGKGSSQDSSPSAEWWLLPWDSVLAYAPECPPAPLQEYGPSPDALLLSAAIQSASLKLSWQLDQLNNRIPEPTNPPLPSPLPTPKITGSNQTGFSTGKLEELLEEVNLSLHEQSLFGDMWMRLQNVGDEMRRCLDARETWQSSTWLARQVNRIFIPSESDCRQLRAQCLAKLGEVQRHLDSFDRGHSKRSEIGAAYLGLANDLSGSACEPTLNQSRLSTGQEPTAQNDGRSN